jgi:hypothetical protein
MNNTKFLLKASLICIVFIFFLSCSSKHPENLRMVYDLSGTWQFSTDYDDEGISGKWYLKNFTDSILLPGTLDENKKGRQNTDTTDIHLNRIYRYYGPAWFKKEINIPTEWEGKHIELIMERTKVTHVWFDTTYIGTSNSIFSKQVYDLSDFITPGNHTLTVQVNNDIKLVPVEGSHAYEENTQTNWNGIIGKFCLEISNRERIKNIKVYPDIDKKLAKVIVILDPGDKTPKNVAVALKAEVWNTSEKKYLRTKTYSITEIAPCKRFELVYDLGKKAISWSEFNPVLYRLHVTLTSDGEPLDYQTVDFGFREFKTGGTNFTINGLKTFLRGKHDGCIFPLTGYPPMDTAGWTRVFRIAKSYGINHYRFHSWCPPEAAFIAADICGIYLQPELPAWWSFKAQDSSQVAFMMNEGYTILDNYGNHASFVMFALGNELFQDRTILQQMVTNFRQYDSRHLYAQGSNNWLGDPKLAEGDDYWTSFRTGTEKSDCSTDLRASFSFLDSREGGILNTFYPSTDRTYSKAISSIPVPVIGHEIGQYQVYPDYNEIPKYTGILKPWNLEIFRKRLADKGMDDQASDYFMASGKFASILYRDEIELAIRTPGFGGFQLLDLQDYSGQGTALVGMLDAFMDSKGLISPEEFRQFCNDVVLLLIMPRFCWTTRDTINAAIQIANYGLAALTQKTISWRFILKENDRVMDSGNLTKDIIPQGEITTAGEIKIKPGNLEKATEARIEITLEGTGYKTQYPIWVYPAVNNVITPVGIKIASLLTPDVISTLNAGGKVLFFPDLKANENNSVEGMYITDFWNWDMFRKFTEMVHKKVSPGTMGIITNPVYPLFVDFPTDFHSNRQWWAIVKNSRPLILDNTPREYRPIVQVIDNIGRNHKLGLIFEFRVGTGKILVCASNLPALTDKPEAQQLYASILKYMQLEQFNPPAEISITELKRLLR